MSVEATSWVWNHSRSRGTARLVLLRIADFAGKHGENAWPGVETLMRDCGVSKRETVRQALRKLEDLGELVCYLNAGGTEHTRPDRRPNRFDLPLVPGYVAPDFARNTTPRETGTRDGPPRNGSTTPRETGTYPLLIYHEPSENRHTDFGVFWDVYPHKVEKHNAAKKWAKLSEADRVAAIDAVPAYIAYVESHRAAGFDLQYRGGAVFLNKRTWDDDLTPRQQSQPQMSQQAKNWATIEAVLGDGGDRNELTA